MRRLPDQIERQIGKAQIDLERRRMPAPFRQALPKHQRIVAKSLEIIGPRGLMRIGHRRVECPAVWRRLAVTDLVRLDNGKAWHQM